MGQQGEILEMPIEVGVGFATLTDTGAEVVKLSRFQPLGRVELSLKFDEIDDRRAAG